MMVGELRRALLGVPDDVVVEVYVHIAPEAPIRPGGEKNTRTGSLEAVQYDEEGRVTIFAVEYDKEMKYDEEGFMVPASPYRYFSEGSS
jgi:hypothetical protein